MNRLILCEGLDDAAVITGLLTSLGRADEFLVEDVKGRDNMGRVIRALPSRSDFVHSKIVSLGVVLDAEDNAAAAWQAISDRVNEAFNVVLPGHAQVSIGVPKIGAFIVPDGNSRGMIETVCLAAIEESVGFECYQNYVTCYEAAAQTSLHTKQKMTAWMATHCNYRDTFRGAVINEVFPWTHEAFAGLRGFLQLL